MRILTPSCASDYDAFLAYMSNFEVSSVARDLFGVKHRRATSPMPEAVVDMVTVPNLSERLISVETTAQISARFAYGRR